MTLRRRLVLAGLLFAAVVPLGWATYAAIGWLAYGRAFNSPSADSLVDKWMPVHEVAEVHDARIAAPVAATWAAIEALDFQKSAIVRTIFRSREILLGASPQPAAAPTRMLDQLRAGGWTVLEELPGREIVLGTVTQPWKADVVFRAIPRDAYAAFDSADYVKIVISFAADSLGPAESRFRTETRVLTTDAAARAKFRRYWAFLSPGIILIREQGRALLVREALAMAGAKSP